LCLFLLHENYSEDRHNVPVVRGKKSFSMAFPISPAFAQEIALVGSVIGPPKGRFFAFFAFLHARVRALNALYVPYL
jgi:hypothetical protein